MPRNHYKTLLLLPYFNTSHIFTIARFTFIPKKQLAAYLNNPSLLQHIISILNMYKSPSGHIINSPTIVTHSGKQLKNPTSYTLNKLQNIRSAMTFASFLKNNSWSFTTSDNFDLVIQRFNIGDDGLALQGGSIHGILSGGLQISRSTFTTPAHIYISNFHNTFAGEILTGIIKCIQDRHIQPQSSAVLRSLRAFSFAYKNGPDIDLSVRVLSMITAFEQLFGVSSRRQFREAILKYAEELQPSSYAYNEINTTDGSTIRSLSLTGTQVWAEEFYKLRHRIIHADIIIDQDYKFKDLNGVFAQNNSHVAISFEIYAVCLINKLREIGKVNDYHIAVIEKKKTSRTDKNFMNIQNREFSIVDLYLHDKLSRI